MIIPRVIYALWKLRFQWELAFRVDALLALGAHFLYVASGILFFEVIYAQTESIGGWSRPEALALVGTLALLLELESGLLRGGLQHLPDLVRQGWLEHYLLRPAPAPLLLAFRDASLKIIWRLPLGVAIIVYAISLIPPSPERLVLYSLSLFISLGIYSLMVFCLVCLSFWVIEMQNLFWVVYDLVEFARYPASVYKGVFRFVLSTVLPLVVLANFPVELLLRNASPWLLIHQLLVFLGFLGLGWILWKKGLQRYQGASI